MTDKERAEEMAEYEASRERSPNGSYSRTNPHKRFWSRVDKSGSCWTWVGSIRDTLKGVSYGYFYLDGKHMQSHRVALVLSGVSLIPGMVVDHLCRNPLCVNPSHLEQVPQRINILRGVGWSAINARKKECARGHKYTPENTRKSGHGRRCIECCRAYSRKHHLKMKAKAKKAEGRK